MLQDFYVEIALDVNKHFYQEKKSFLLTRLPTIGEGDWYSYHDTERRQRKFIYKEIYCIRLPPNINNELINTKDILENNKLDDTKKANKDLIQNLPNLVGSLGIKGDSLRELLEEDENQDYSQIIAKINTVDNVFSN